MPFPFMASVAAAQAGMSYLNSASQRRAQRRYMEYMKRLDAPRMKAQSFLAGKIGAESPRLAAAHRLSMQNIGQSAATQGASSRGFWKRSGNEARGRGESMQIEDAARRARNEASLGYAGAQEEYGMAPAYALAGGSMAAGMGAGQGILGQGQAGQDLLGDMSGILGSVTGWWQLKQLLDRYNLGGGEGENAELGAKSKWT